ncbi:putative Por secretion system C-terminal sorting domain-containing protein [Tenacibaculum xiamenense]
MGILLPKTKITKRRIVKTNKLLFNLPLFLFTLTTIANEIVDIPDPKFKQILLDRLYINTNGDDEIQISEAEAFDGFLNCRNREIKSLKGIEAFINIVRLDCSINEIQNLDLSKNVELTRVNCGGNLLRSINISQCIKLTDLNCNNNLYLSAFDLSTCVNLEKIDFSQCKLVEADLSNNINLMSLDGRKNALTSITFPNNGKLRSVRLENNKLVDIDFKTNDNLRIVGASYNELQSINISGCSRLRTIHIINNHLPTINTSRNLELESLQLNTNEITQLDLSENIRLRSLGVRSNHLKNIDLSKNIALRFLTISYNQIEGLDLSKNLLLETIYASNNEIKELDLSVNIALETVSFRSNRLESLNLKNGKNTLITTFEANENPNLTCIQVDNPTDSANNAAWKKDDPAIYSETCQTASIDDPLFNDEVGVVPNPVINNAKVTLKNQYDYKKCTIFNNLGQEVFKTTSHELDLSGLTKGLYLLKVEGKDGRVAIKKIIKS